MRWRQRSAQCHLALGRSQSVNAIDVAGWRAAGTAGLFCHPRSFHAARESVSVGQDFLR